MWRVGVVGACLAVCACGGREVEPPPKPPAVEVMHEVSEAPPEEAPELPESEAAWAWVASGSAFDGVRMHEKLPVRVPRDDPSQVRMVAGPEGRSIARIRDYADSAVEWMVPSPTGSNVSFFASTRSGAFVLLGTKEGRVVVEARRLEDGAPLWSWSREVSEGAKAQLARAEETSRLVVQIVDGERVELVELDEESGAPTATRALSATERALAARAWSWSGGTWAEERDRSTVEVSEGGVVARFERPRRGAPSIARVDDGATWRVELPEGGLVNGRILVGEGVIHVTTGSAVSSGVTVRALDAATGKEIWSRPLLGLGRVVHSEYMSAFTFAREGDLLVVHGRESSGRYIEWLDPKTGRSRVNLRFFDE